MDTASQRVATPARALPTGTVTFLFTDIEGSTERWESHREAMQAAVARHDALMRAAIETHGGYVFKTVGDAFCAAFRTSPNAIRAALEAQRTLLKEDFSSVDGLSIRAALHTGYTDERDGDYFGPTVNRVARLLSIGHGGQILISAATSNLAQGELPPQSSLRDLGAHRLKDLAHPEHVFQLVAIDLPADFPPLRSLDALPNNLPLQVTSLIGRENDVEQVKKLLEKTRLLTLSGPAGVGKTRLALQVGADLLDRYSDGVWVIELATLTDPDLVPSEAASALNVRVESDRSLTDSIVYVLKPKQVLLILDDCEHLVGAAAKFAGAVIHGCPKIHIITTSREGLGIEGEDIVRVASLAVPERSEVLTAESAQRFGAVALFADRAVMANKSFRVSDDNVALVADICRRLDGIPFAIELAAARVRALSIADLSHALNERFRVLTGGHRMALPRQKTMRALIDWSYDLLSENERTLLRRVAVFAGGWTLDAASEVCQGDGIDALDVLDLLSSLVDKSLVVAETGGKTARYRLLESTREYALEKLAESGERPRLSRAHAEFFSAIARKADDAWAKVQTQEWLAQLEPELDNFRAAMEWSVSERHDVALGGALAGNLGLLWFYGGSNAEGLRWIEGALSQLGDGNSETAARVWLGLSQLTEGRPCYDAAERARSLYESLGDQRGTARATYRAAFGLRQLGRHQEAEAAFRRAAEILRKAGDEKDVALAMDGVANVRDAQGDTDTARRLRTESLATARALGDDELKSVFLANLAELEFAQGHLEQAVAYSLESISLQHKNYLKVAIDYCNIAAYRMALGQIEQARDDAREGIRLAQVVQSDFQVALALQHLSLIGALRGDVRRASRLLGFVNTVFAKFEYPRERTETICFERLMSLLREGLSENEISALLAEGGSWSEGRAIEEALKI